MLTFLLDVAAKTCPGTVKIPVPTILLKTKEARSTAVNGFGTIVFRSSKLELELMGLSRVLLAAGCRCEASSVNAALPTDS